MLSGVALTDENVYIYAAPAGVSLATKFHSQNSTFERSSSLQESFYCLITWTSDTLQKQLSHKITTNTL
jgi:hypothetical protein